MLSTFQRNECIAKVHWDVNPKGFKYGDDFYEKKSIRNHEEEK
jgi:hypothetical protein